jgi:hypothetical protein
MLLQITDLVMSDLLNTVFHRRLKSATGEGGDSKK